MEELDFSEVLGTNVIYEDYLGQKRYGKVAMVEPYLGPDAVDEEGKTSVWMYIADDDYDYNIHPFNVIDSKTGEMKQIMYAEVRISSEVYIDKEEV